VTLEQIGLDATEPKALHQAAHKAMGTKHIGAENVPVSEDLLVEAILKADALGRDWRRKQKG